MNCPYCNKDMEKGTMIVDNAGCVTLIYQSEEDAAKKGFLAKLKSDPIVMLKYKRDKEEAYYCKSCKKIMTIYNES